MLSERRTIRISKFLSLVLRHRPEEIGLRLDEAGWASVPDLLEGCQRHGLPVTLAELKEVVATSDKQRFAFSDDGRHIRANQGQSVQVDLGYEPAVPPEILYHGTAEHNLPSIRRDGLNRGKRHHVHLSATVETAQKVGKRHGAPVVLEILAGEMHRQGALFFKTPNGVWLTDAVPPNHIRNIPPSGPVPVE